MKGGLIQLVVKGKLDEIVLGNPNVNYFKEIIIKRKSIAVTNNSFIFKGSGSFGRTTSCIIPKMGDLLGKTYLRIILPRLPAVTIPGEEECNQKYYWVDSVGFAMIEKIDLLIGGNVMDSKTGEWLYLWSELSSKNIAKYNAMQNMVGNVEGISIGQSLTDNLNTHTDTYTLCVPLDFWFCKDISLALPLVALQYQDVEIKITIKALDDLVVKHIPTPKSYVTSENAQESRRNEIQRINPAELAFVIPDILLWCDYILLDNEERDKIAQSDYLIMVEQLQHTHSSITGKQEAINLPFNGLVKEIIWVLQQQSIADRLEYFNYTDAPFYIQSFDSDTGNVLLTGANIMFNNEDRISYREAIFYNLINPYEHHSWIPSTGIFTWSLVENPEDINDIQGSCNFSRLQDATLNIISDRYYKNRQQSIINCRIYAKSINYFKISNGMADMVISIV